MTLDIHYCGETRRVHTAYEWPPTPLPGFWRAWDDDLGPDSGIYGQGGTEQEAIDDLLAQMDDTP
jgi:hypothetical protein